MRLIGIYKGQEFIFDLVEEKNGRFVFRADFPSSETGTAIIELKATDDAGNVGTRVDMIILIDFKSLMVKVLYSSKCVKENARKYGIRKLQNEKRFYAKEIKLSFGIKELESRYKAVVFCDA